jgi:hypothetical protein
MHFYMIADKLESDADISVEFRENIGDPTADAVSHAYRGHIAIANSAPTSALTAILTHELLHCAGESHDEDPTSVMYPKTRSQVKLQESQIRDLRRLSGITWPERLVAQCRNLF